MDEKKRFGLWTLTFLVIANMIGAGVYTTSGFTLAALGSPALVVFAWGVAGLIAIAGAYSYGQLVKAMPESGGEYLFLSRAAHPLAGFIAGWISLIAGFTGAIALAAITCESYLLPESVRPSWLPENGLAISIVIVSGLYHGYRPRIGAIIQNISVLLKLLFLVSFFLFAMLNMPELGQNAQAELPVTESSETWNIIFAFASSLVWISFSYAGFNAAIYVAEEVPNPRIVIPKSLVLGTCLVMIIYVGLNFIFVYSAPAEALSNKTDVAVISAKHLGGEGLSNFIRIIISVSLFTSVSSMMMAAPRVYSKMADDQLLPSFFQFQNGSPKIATLSEIILASMLIIYFSSVKDLLNYLSLTLLLCSTLTVCTLFSSYVKNTPSFQSSGIRFLKWIPTFYILASLLSALLLVINKPSQLIGTGITLLAGGIVYVIMAKTKKN